MDDLIISPSTKSSLPLTIQQILEDKQKSNEAEEAIDMWTPEAEKKYQLQMQSLNSKERNYPMGRSVLNIWRTIGRLVEFMDTSISAEIKAAKASELLKMVNHWIILYEAEWANIYSVP